MKKNHSMFNRRGFIKRGLLFVPGVFYIPKFGSNPIVVELFNRDGSEVIHIPRGGLNAASVIKARTFSSVVDNRIQLSNSNFARLWSSDLGTSWTTLRLACRISMTLTGADLTSTPRFSYGVCSGTSNIYMDATTTHWYGLLSIESAWYYYTNGYAFGYGGTHPQPTKRITTTNTSGSSWNVTPRAVNSTTENRSVLFLDITKGSPNFTGKIFCRNGDTTGDVTLATYLAQAVLSSPTVTNHTMSSDVTLAIDEATNGYFNAVNIAWNRSDALMEISDIAVVRLA